MPPLEPSSAPQGSYVCGRPSNGAPLPPVSLKPRAQRFPIQTPVRYRESGQTAWSEGVTVNISRSGVLFRAPEVPEPKTVLEMQILLPAEVTGGMAANVVCLGPVVRAEPPLTSEDRPAVAAAILQYRFTHDVNDNPP